jgi:hypothetical protein
MTRHYSRHSGNKFPVLPLTLKLRSKRNLRENGVIIYQCLQRPTSPATISAKQILPNLENLQAELFFQKKHHSMPHVVPVRQPELHLPICRCSSAYIRKPADESNAIFFWTTEKQSSKLRSKNTSWIRYLIYSQNLPPQSDEMQTLHIHISKSHTYKKPSMQHT